MQSFHNIEYSNLLNELKIIVGYTDLKILNKDKNFNIQNNIGKAKYIINFHNGIKKHKDNSKFYDIRICKNKKELKTFTDNLRKKGYYENIF